jgi:hypothetical protein
MLINGTYIENNCKKLLQKTISFELKNKTIKKGKLVLFYQRNFYLVFVLETDKKKKDKIEIPIPFDIEFHEDDDLMYFDYRIAKLKKHLFDVEPYFSLFNPKVAKSKYFNTILTINGK